MCIECGKSNVEVDKHIIFHTMEKQSSCEQCGKAFTQKLFFGSIQELLLAKAIYVNIVRKQSQEAELSEGMLKRLKRCSKETGHSFDVKTTSDSWRLTSSSSLASGASHKSQPSECGRERTLNIVHAQTAAQQQSNGSYEARISRKCGEWRD